jgi:small subunit ribosomal protein S9
VSADEGLSVTDETVETIDTEAPAAEPAAVVVATVETPAPVVVVETTATAKVPTRSRRAGQPIQTVGRRKEAIVRVRLIPGTGKFLLNGRELENYFPSKVQQQTVKEPLVIVEKVDQFDVFANLRGGGTTGQAGGLRLAIARALIENDPDDRPALKKAGFLIRDARATERKKYGLKKARKAPQYSKR